MVNQKSFLNQVSTSYYVMLKIIHEQLDSEKDPALYERILLLELFAQKSDDVAFIRHIEQWILERRSLIEYFCNEGKIENCLEAIIASYRPEEIGINPFVHDIAHERLKQVKNGIANLMEDE